MRINHYVAQATGMSRRTADQAIQDGLVTINGRTARLGAIIEANDVLMLDKIELKNKTLLNTIMLNKPVGYVCSRDGQGSQTVYNLLPSSYHHLKPVGRLDKNSSGLLLLTNNGQLAHELTHPSFGKKKNYRVTIDKNLSPEQLRQLRQGIKLDDGISKLHLTGHNKQWTVQMSEGRNRQIRRTFGALGIEVLKLHRTAFGPYQLGALGSGKYQEIMV